jgi:uncharacterized protein (TIGR03437 family)
VTESYNRVFLGLLILQALASGQSVSISLGSGSGTAGGTVSLPVNVTSLGGAAPAAVQWSFSYTSDITSVSVVTGSAASAGGKSVSCNGNVCLVWGLNSNTISNGAVATATFQIAANPSTSTIPIQITGVVAASLAGSAISASGASGSVSVPPALTAPAQVTGIACAPSSLSSNASSTCTVTLNQAAAGSTVVAISSTVAALSVPSSLTIAAGQTSGTFSVTTGTVSSAQSVSVTAALNGQQQTATVELTMPAVPSLLTCSPGTVTAPGSSSCTITLSAATPSSGASVTLSSNNTSLTVPASVTVAAGQTTGTFAATVASIATNQTAQITASYNGSAQTFSLTASSGISLQSLTCGPQTLRSDATLTCTLTLTEAPASAMTVAVSSANPQLLVPSSVTIAAAAGVVRFGATTSTVTADATVAVSVTWNGQTMAYSISLKGGPQLKGFTCASSTLASNASTTCAVSIQSTSTSAVTVDLSQNGSYLTIPSQVAIAADTTSATFTVSNASTGVTSVTEVLTSSVNAQSLTAEIGLVAAPQVSALSCSSSSVNSQGSTTCTVSLTTGAPSTGLGVTLSSSNTNVSTPATLSIPAGRASVNFTASVGSLTSDGTATLTASVNGSTSTTVLSLSAAQLGTLSCSPATLSAGQTASCTIGLLSPATGPSAVAIQPSSSIVTAPATVTATAGQTTIGFQLVSGVPATPQRVIITASAGTKSVQTSITIQAGSAPSVGAPAARTVTAARPVQFKVTQSDPNRLPVSLSASNLPAGASFDTGTGDFQWTPALSQTGEFNVTVTATNSAGLSASKNVLISVVPPKALVQGLYNVASNALDQTCSPGSLAAVAGSGFTGQALQQAPPAPRPPQLAGARVLLNNTAAPILSASDTLIQFQCPALSPGTQISLVVQPANGQPSDPMQFTLNEATPGLFELDGTAQGTILIEGTNQLAMLATDAMPSRPANIGEYLSIYANGLGPLQQTVAPNTPATPAPLNGWIEAADQVVVFVGNTPLSPSFAGLAPGLAGVYEVNVQLIQGVTMGDSVPVYVEVILSDGTVMKSNTVTVAIQNSALLQTARANPVR